MKSLILACFLLTGCTLSKSTLERGPLYKVGDSFKTDPEFYLGSGKIQVTAVLYGACSTPKKFFGWVYIGTMKNSLGQILDDVEICENELKAI